MLARRVILFLAILWLPLQGVVAVAMPFCPHSLGRPAISSEPEHSDLSCNGCGVCHLACAPAVAAATSLAFAPADSIYSQLYSTFIRLFIPEQPQPPPNPSI